MRCSRSGQSGNSPSLCTERPRSEEHTSELQSRQYLVCRLLLEKKNPTASRVTLRCRAAAPTRTPRPAGVAVTATSRRVRRKRALLIYTHPHTAYAFFSFKIKLR